MFNNGVNLSVRIVSLCFSSLDEACLDEAGGDSDALIYALNVIARAKNLGQVDKDSGLINDELYQVFASDSSLTFAMVAKFVNTLGFKLTIEPII